MLLRSLLFFLSLVLFPLPVMAVLPASDTFSGVTGDLPTADDTTWAYNRNAVNPMRVVTGGIAQIADNTVDAALHWTGDTFATNHCSQGVMAKISIVGTGVGQGYGFIVDADTATTQKTFIRWVGDSHGWELQRFNNAVTTTLTSDTAAIVIGDSIELCTYHAGTTATYTIKRGGAHLAHSPYLDTSPLAVVGAPGIAHSSDTSTGGTSDWGITSWSGYNAPAGGFLLLGIGH